MEDGIVAWLLAGVAGLACGFLNTAASSGSAVSLPILMAIGLDPVTANATNRLPVLVGARAAARRVHRPRAITCRPPAGSGPVPPTAAPGRPGGPPR